jgi:hypothetical protein
MQSSEYMFLTFDYVDIILLLNVIILSKVHRNTGNQVHVQYPNDVQRNPTFLCNTVKSILAFMNAS